jgi:hypothetical protein
MIPETPTTDSEGIARAQWILGWQPGNQEASATTSGASDPAVFAANAQGFKAQGLSTGDGDHRCVIDLARALWCWGPNGAGELGDGTTSDRDAPVAVLLNQPVAQVVTAYLSDGYSCALTDAGEAYCWGSNDLGQLGNGTTVASAVPVRVLLPAEPFKSLSASYAGVCAVSEQGEAYCWGHNGYGRFGNGTADGVLSTPALAGGGLRWRQVALSDDRACGVRDNGEVYCWGRDDQELGTGVDTNTVSPLSVVNAPVMDSIALTGWHQCGITSSGETYCWGTNRNIGVEDPRAVIPEPIALGAPPFRSIQAIFKPTFALGTDGKGYWWGPPPFATGGRPTTPEIFSGDIPLSTIGTNGFGVCGIEATTNTVFCWSSFGWTGPEQVVALAPQ